MCTDATSPLHANWSPGVPSVANSTLRELYVQVVNAVVAGEGLTRVAELTATAAGAPVIIVAPQLGGPWVGPREQLVQERLRALELAVIGHLRDPSGAPPGELARTVPIASKSIKGMVGLLRSGRPVHPGALEYLQVAALAALTEGTLTEARSSGNYGMRGSLLKDLRGRDDVDRDQILRRVALLGCTLNRGAVAICAAVGNERSGQVLAMIASDFPDALAEYDTTANPEQDTRRLYALVPGSGRERDEVADLAEATLMVARRLGVRIGRDGTVGLSSYCADAAELPCAIQQAELMLELLLQSDTPSAGEIGANGTYRLLLGLLSSRPEELRLLYRDTVAPLVGYDDRYHTQLVPTLETYLSQNCNMNATAGTIGAHRHTIAYRLDRIKELSGLDPGQPDDRERLGLGLKAYHLVRLQPPH